ncbi:GNAT family N-acetyltransferase [Psychroserpens burtonensis]|uniref:GNAT family N-acetyltransferase n=1 Tax=Psychroserpens burtonensis TaxID=49278 RepID=A0A5C7B7I6_9FLAO|nr:GNAT family N-acetyltransferase [Psychroserpens burtonensis]TXE16936.1 GNAT family N-acetyltransferase [Psychroserpens burtonensis]
MIKIIRTDSKNRDFNKLVTELDAYLKITDGDEHDFYNQFNGIDILNNVLVAYVNDELAGCGAFKEFESLSVEIKRMFTKPEMRGNGIASAILKALELWASELNYKACVLETGIRQKEAVAFYKKNDYKSITNYSQYVDMENSLCFKKII